MGSGWSAVLAPRAAAPTAELSRNFTSEKLFTRTAVLLGEHLMPAKNPVRKKTKDLKICCCRNAYVLKFFRVIELLR